MNEITMNEKPKALAVVAHPDDIEFMMLGTLLMLQRRGWEIHYMTVADGCCGSDSEPADVVAARRKAECQASCALTGAVWHPSLCHDLEVFYNWEIGSRLLATVREIRPQILLTQSPDDYMEDHINTCRLAVSAAFCRGMLNAPCNPPRPVFQDDIVVYHAIPHGLMDPFRKPIEPDFYVNVTPVMQMKWDALACHKSQKEWLDVSQGMDAYQKTMQDFMAQLGARSGKFPFAEGFRRRSWLGFSAQEWDPIREVLPDDTTPAG